MDDELPLLSSFRRQLQGADFDADFALSGEEALKRLLSKDPPDIVVSDIIMRPPDGPEVFRQVLATDASWENRYIFVTGNPDKAEQLVRAASRRVVVLHKPISSEHLVSTIRSRLALTT